MSSKMFQEMDRIIDQVSKEKNIPRERLIDAIEGAFLSAARKKWGHLGELESHYNEESGEIELFQFKEVADNVVDPNIQMTVAEAKKLDPDAVAGDSLGVKMDPSVFGRIAAQTAKQVIIQKVREAERDIVHDEFKDRVDEIITGIVRRFERGDIVVDLGRAEAVIPRSEQVPSEHYKSGERIQGYCIEIRKEGRGPQIVLSRRSRELVRKLFEMEVPEISEGIVSIRAVAREAGFRSKIAVYSKDSDVDPVGACVGMKGSRVQSVVQELRGEKIDIIAWDVDEARFACNSIAPAEVVKVIIKEKNHAMEVVVPDDQLSLAIGRRGLNVRLAAQLTGWNIDVFSESHVEELAARQKAALGRILEIDDGMALVLHAHAFRTIEEILDAGEEEFISIPGLDKAKLEALFTKAKESKENGIVTANVIAEIVAEQQAKTELLKSAENTMNEESAAEETVEENTAEHHDSHNS